jgi:hypothetical protein
MLMRKQKTPTNKKKNKTKIVKGGLLNLENFLTEERRVLSPIEKPVRLQSKSRQDGGAKCASREAINAPVKRAEKSRKEL